MKTSGSQLELPLASATSSVSESHRTTDSTPKRELARFAPTASEHHVTTNNTLDNNEAIERRRTNRQILSHHWECTVDALIGETFLATLRSLKDPADSEKEAEIPVDEVSSDDRELLEVGAVFYWTMGYEVSPSGTRRRFSQIKFRRLPAWTRRDLRHVEQRADALFQMFGAQDDAHEKSRAG